MKVADITDQITDDVFDDIALGSNTVAEVVTNGGETVTNGGEDVTL